MAGECRQVVQAAGRVVTGLESAVVGCCEGSVRGDWVQEREVVGDVYGVYRCLF